MRSLSWLLSAAVFAAAFSAPDGVGAQAPAGRQLSVAFDMAGNVTLVARNVTVREILAEWTRLGGSQFVNGDRLAGGPVSLVFENRPEGEVLQSILRTASGYILGPRRADRPGASRFEVVYILPTSTPVQTGVYTSPQPQPAAPSPGSPDSEIPPVTPPLRPVDPNQPINQPAAPAQAPTYQGPSGVSVPIVPIAPVTTGRGRGGGGGF
jgi:hypothetical protein